MIANLIHPLVYAPGANMPQDAVDDLRVTGDKWARMPGGCGSNS